MAEKSTECYNRYLSEEVPALEVTGDCGCISYMLALLLCFLQLLLGIVGDGMEETLV